MVSFLVVILLALVALWLAVGRAEVWQRHQRVTERMLQRPDEEGPAPQSAVLSMLSRRVAGSSFAKADYLEMANALRLTGRSAESIQTIYLIACWMLPAAVAVLGLVLGGIVPFMVLLAVGFILPRRMIRGMGHSSCRRQNLEAIEFGHVLRMLIESGLSIERAIRIATLQARELMPTMIYRLDRFGRLMEAGADRSEALAEMGGDRNVPVLYNLTQLLKQGSRLGGGITSGIEQIINEGQNIEKSRIKEDVNRVGAKMTIVMMVFMLPALFIIIGGPAIVSIGQALSR
ncbi:type II secretion system protein F domain-containing protein [Isoalcanivorax pacificus W11-5]|uniref:Type II secretion system protein F domain-containing protein n=1 Tax=Isoalcanivorax pacificus W11-5 TaxID=391936 RepID=A0A0B4XHJ0_9GAMM|nr:type II secretion system F family protein [Isoalcanivorax pacificus]AJD46521.1 type II secretion system protein F domain-containing protein [Isoalcanivorax pacificus W11-5]